jgi:hypothetical protein
MRIKTQFLTLIVFILTASLFGEVQEDCRPHITAIDRDVNRDLLQVPQSFDCTVHWDAVRQQSDGLWISCESPPFDRYQVRCYEGEILLDSVECTLKESKTAVFKSLNPNTEYHFSVMGISASNRVESDFAFVTTGKKLAAMENEIQWWHRLPISGRMPLHLINRERFYDKATEAGKMAFTLIWWFFLAAIFIWTQCLLYLRLGYVFPLTKTLHIGQGYDAIFKKARSKAFMNTLESWKKVIDDANGAVRTKLASSSQLGTRDIETVGAVYWQQTGAKEMQKLIGQMKDYTESRSLEDVRTILIQRFTAEELKEKERPTEAEIEAAREKARARLKAMPKSELRCKGVDYPTGKIFMAGMRNHELNGFHWMKASEEIDRAIENRAASEMEKLRRKSFMDWLWNLGTFAPMVGLFGTATGISSAFGKLESMGSSIQQLEMVQNLAGGIYEALWTTIEGLAVGVMLMLVYYFYQNKLNWIYSKWEDLYVDISEKI